MAVQKPSIPKGTRDFSPEQVAKRKYILSTIEKVFVKYGFMPIETPTMENLSTLEGKYGDEGDKLLFRILNSGDAFKEIKEKNGDQQISNFEFRISELSEKGLRYDLTVPFARYVVMHQNEITFPFKRYQMQPVWRADRPQKGRYREFWQCDADVVGSDSLLNELDLIQIYDEAFRLLGMNNYELRINNRKILAGIASSLGAESRLSEFAGILDKLDKIGVGGVKNELLQNGFYKGTLIIDFLFENFFNEKSNDDRLSYLDEIKLFENNEIAKKGIEELATILNYIQSSNHKINLKFDLTLARGLSYYTGSIFEVVSTEGTLKSSIGGGGRYDNLTGIFGLPNVSGVGISFGLDRIYDVMEELNLFPQTIKSSNTKILICCFDSASQHYALSCLKKLRDANIPAEIYPDIKKIGKQLDYANALKIPYACIIGENEITTGNLVLKDLYKGTQQEIPLDAIIKFLNR
jgi:histidyl-tRNA synthetase